jgi:hypothetical protein
VRTTPLAAALLGLLLAAGAHAQMTGSGQSFPVEWARRSDPWLKPAVEGYVHNDSMFRVGNVRLRVEVLDSSSRPVNERFAWVHGNIDAGARGYFVLSLPEAGHTYRITVVSFDLISRQAP